MAKIPQQDPKTSEILSPFIAGLSEAVSKLSESTNMKVESATNVQLTEVFVSDSDRYRIYQAPDGKRNWTSDTVTIFKNGVAITQDTAHFTIDRVGGSITFEPDYTLTASDIITANFSYVEKVVYTEKETSSNKVTEILSTATNAQYPSAKAVYDFLKGVVDADRINPYPVNALYISVDPTDPSTYFGGTWERIKDTFILAAGDTYAAGTTGGEATHTLTVAELPSHTHRTLYYTSSGSQGFGYNFQKKGEWSNQVAASSGIGDTGGNGAHNNMPPYLAVYVWKRTA